jgi:predicted permease
MSHLRRLIRRLANALRPGRAERQLAREMESHLALLEEDFVRRGLTPEQARAAARRAFGGVEQAKEVQRDARSFVWLEDARRDIGYAARTLARTPGFTVVAILTLALGIGAVTVIYSLVRNVLLQPFPYPHSQRMIDVVVRDSSGRILRGALPVPEFLDYQEQSQAFDDVMGTLTQSMHWVSEAGSERLTVGSVTPNAFTFLGVRPLHGRVFGAADAVPGAPPVAVMNHRTWVTMFGGATDIVGRTLVLNGEPRTVIGIMPPRFEWHVADLWIPGAISRTAPDAGSTVRWFQARLKPGVSVAEAQAQIDVIATRRAAEYPREHPPGSYVQVITVIDWVVGQFRSVLYTLFAAVALLLVIACCNVANMLLARATAREREIAVRAALGASRGRIVRQLLTESAILALGGVAAGSLLAYAGIDLLAQLMPRQGVPWETKLRLDFPVLAFAIATAAFATLAFGLFPALQSVRRELVAGANSSGRSGTAVRRQTRMRSGLVVAEVTLSIILLLAAGILMRTFVKLAGADLGFDARNLLHVRIWFPPREVAEPSERQAFYRQAVDRIGAIPGVSSVAVSDVVPPFGGLRTPVEVRGTPPSDQPVAIVQFCSEQYFETLGLRLIAGRPISPADVQGLRPVAIVSDTFARKYFGTMDTVGQTIRMARLAKLPKPIDSNFEIVGVVQDVANQGVRERPVPHAYVPYTFVAGASLAFSVRTSVPPMQLLNAVKREIQTVNRMVAVPEPDTLENFIHRVFYVQPRFSVIVLGMFAGAGLVLVALGVYGVLAYTVSQQSREIAIRMALGGDRGHVLRMVFRMGMRLLGLGVVAGLAASFATNRLLVSQLWNTSPHDPVTLAAAVAIVGIIGMCACWVPARRAIRVEPITALRHE